MTPEEWEQVQDIIDRRPTIMKGNACPFYNLFHGLCLLYTSWALHLDEGTPHIHERHVFDCENRYGELCP